jgi:hypothetical protein
MVSNVVELYRFSIAYGGGNWFAAKKAIERGLRGRARIIADKTKKDQRQYPRFMDGEKKRMKSGKIETKWGRFRSPDSAASSAIRVFPLRLGHILYRSFFAGQDLKRIRNFCSGQPKTKVCPYAGHLCFPWFQ